MITRQFFLGFFSKIKMRSVFFPIIIIQLIFATSCIQPSTEPDLDFTTVEKELRAFETANRIAVDSGDIDGILKYYSSDAITIPPSDSILYGREWIRTLLVNLYKDYEFHEVFEFIDIRIYGNRIAATYTYSQNINPLIGGEQITQTGNGMCILKKSEEGIWQFEWNAYNLNKMDKTMQE